MEQNNKYIEELLEKFFDGNTNNKEEKELYDFFSKGNVPANFRKYKPVLHYLECGIGNEIMFSEEDSAIVGVDDSEIRTENKTQKTLLNKWVLAIAASLMLIIGAKVYQDFTAFDPYEGSYIQRDGIIISDRDALEAEQERLEKYVNEKTACLNESRILAEQQMEIYNHFDEE